MSNFQKILEELCLEATSSKIIRFDVGIPNKDGNPETVWINNRRFQSSNKSELIKELYDFCSSLSLDNIGKRKITKVTLKDTKKVYVNQKIVRNKSDALKIINKIQTLFSV